MMLSYPFSYKLNGLLVRMKELKMKKGRERERRKKPIVCARENPLLDLFLHKQAFSYTENGPFLTRVGVFLHGEWTFSYTSGPFPTQRMGLFLHERAFFYMENGPFLTQVGLFLHGEWAFSYTSGLFLHREWTSSYTSRPFPTWRMGLFLHERAFSYTQNELFLHERAFSYMENGPFFT